MATIVHGGGGGGVSSSELTTIAANVLAGTKYVGKDTNDELGTGTMVNKGGTVTATSTTTYDSTNKRITMKIPATGYYTTSSYIYEALTDFGTATTDQVLKGKTFTSSNSGKLAGAGTMPDNSTTTSNGTVPGVSSSLSSRPTRPASATTVATDTNNVKRLNLCVPKGYYPGSTSYVNIPMSNLGDVGAGSVIEGKTFSSNAGLKVTGTLPNYAGKSKAGTVTISSGSISIKPATNSDGTTNHGYYNTTSALTASVPNLTAANIKSGVKIGGLTGTWEGYVATNKEIYDNGAWGSGYSKNTVHNSGSDSRWVLTNDTTCIICDWTGSNQYWTSGDGVFIFSKTSPLNASGYSKLTIETSCQATTGYSYGTPNSLHIGVYSINDTAILTPSDNYVTYTAKDAKVKLSINLANITQSVYFKLYTFSKNDYPGGSNQYSPDFTIYNITLA